MGAENLDLAHFRPILLVLDLNLGSGPGIDPFSAYFGRSGHSSEDRGPEFGPFSARF